jgi:hypothetical protein
MTPVIASSDRHKVAPGGQCVAAHWSRAAARPIRTPDPFGDGRRYHAGDVLSVGLSARGYRQERARIFFRNGGRPLIPG